MKDGVLWVSAELAGFRVHISNGSKDQNGSNDQNGSKDKSGSSGEAVAFAEIAGLRVAARYFFLFFLTPKPRVE